MNSLYLETDRILLRQVRESDFDLLLSLHSDPEVMKHLTYGVPDRPEQIKGVLERCFMMQKKYSGRLGVYMAEELESGECIGWFHLRPDKVDLDNTKVQEVGYRLHRKFWGNGYATEVSKALMEKSFEELGADTFFAQTRIENLASQQVMKKIGLRFDREFEDKVNGGITIVYKLERSDWEK